MALTLENVLGRINKMILGQQKRLPLDTRYEILHKSEKGFWVVNEIGGNDARYALFAEGMDAYVSLVATKDDQTMVVVIGKRSPYIPFDVSKTLEALNIVEPLAKGWGGLDLVGGSPRKTGTGLTPVQIISVAEQVN